MDESNATLDEAMDIKWLIFTNGGNATKSAVEQVLMARHPGMLHADARELTNAIEYHDTLGPSLRAQRWMRSDPEPALADYPQILTADIRWYRGVPAC